MSRALMTDWLAAVESPAGPPAPELRHLCLSLARFMSGTGSAGCFPGTRLLALRVGVHRATVSRWLHQLVQLGWLEREDRRRQFGRLGGHYFPAVPMAHLSAPISTSNGAPKRANPINGASDAEQIGASDRGIGAREAEIGAPGCARSLLQKEETEKSAATPSPATTGAAAPGPEPMSNDVLRNQVRILRLMHWDDARILHKFARHGMTPEHLAPTRDDRP